MLWAAPCRGTLAQQIDAFLASNTLGSTDVVLINLPMTDVG